MKLKVKAGNMLVGYLVVLRVGQYFIDRESNQVYSHSTVSRVRGYRQLKLIKL